MSNLSSLFSVLPLVQLKICWVQCWTSMEYSRCISKPIQLGCRLTFQFLIFSTKLTPVFHTFIGFLDGIKPFDYWSCWECTWDQKLMTNLRWNNSKWRYYTFYLLVLSTLAWKYLSNPLITVLCLIFISQNSAEYIAYLQKQGTNQVWVVFLQVRGQYFYQQRICTFSPLKTHFLWYFQEVNKFFRGSRQSELIFLRL